MAGNSRFKGTLDELKALVAEAGERGEWCTCGDSGHQFRNSAGAVMNWWPSKGTVSFQGAAGPKAALQAALSGPLGGGSAPTAVSSLPAANVGARERSHIFVVHGHDSDARDQLELALHRLGLQPFILMNSTGEGKTIIEALENKIGRDFTSDFGIALFTPDDVGYAKKDGAEQEEPRARQNVVLETGMLLASLTRERMAILVKGHVELPSDLQGIIQLRFNSHVREVVAKLANRLKEAGIEIDSRRIAEATA